MNYYETLEFTTIRSMLADCAVGPFAKNKAFELVPSLSEQICKNLLNETTQAKKILEGIGNPPMDSMENLEDILTVVNAGGMLMPDQLGMLERFLATCKQMVSYLNRSATFSPEVSAYSSYIEPLEDLRNEINKTIRGGKVNDDASSALRSIRRKLENAKMSVQGQLERLLRTNPDWFSEHYVTQRGGRYVLPVKKQHRNNVAGSVIETSGTGATLFIEPRSVQKTQSEIESLSLEEDNEIIQILYTITGNVSMYMGILTQNRDTFQELDFLFAKAKLSLQMKGSPVEITTDRVVTLINARHPLIDKDTCVPLNITFGEDKRGVIITGPNTGGKTVTLKTIGLMSLMAQSGLHIPADPNSVLSMNNLVLCDIGDGQSISANLSTFSAHMTGIIEILRRANDQSLILLDELGSGTDPAEGMGLAIAIIQELLERNCMFVITTHYSEVKDFGSKVSEIINARMAFDRENLQPLYQLELGEVGESCAFYIAQKLGFPSKMLENAHRATYSEVSSYGQETLLISDNIPVIQKIVEKKMAKEIPQYNLGDSVMVSPDKKMGIVYLPTQKDGTVGVQIQKEKLAVSYKRLTLVASATDLYPPDYDFSVIFDSVENRKARNIMGKRHDPNTVITHNSSTKWKTE